MDKKEMKRDVAVFANMLKEMMQDPTQDVLVTLDRDLQHFIYGRVAILVKHNEGKPLGSIADMAAVVGAAFGSVLKEFLQDKVNNAEDLQKLVLTANENLVDGFRARAPSFEQQEPTAEEVKAAEQQGLEV